MLDYDEELASRQIEQIPEEARLHISHAIRNGLCTILSALKTGGNVERAIFDAEARIKELGF